MTDESKAVKIEINGGVLTRAAPKGCDCKVPDVKDYGVQENDEWTCSCGQGWRARFGKEAVKEVDEDENARLVDGIYWKRISKRTRKAKTAGAETATAEATDATPAKTE